MKKFTVEFRVEVELEIDEGILKTMVGSGTSNEDLTSQRHRIVEFLAETLMRRSNIFPIPPSEARIIKQTWAAELSSEKDTEPKGDPGTWTTGQDSASQSG